MIVDYYLVIVFEVDFEEWRTAIVQGRHWGEYYAVHLRMEKLARRAVWVSMMEEVAACAGLDVAEDSCSARPLGRAAHLM